MCFILSAITAVRHLVAKVGLWGTSAKRVGKRHIRCCLRGGPAVARLLRCRIQGDLGPGPWLSGGWRLLSCLLSRHRPRANGSSRKAGALREEVSHHLR